MKRARGMLFLMVTLSVGCGASHEKIVGPPGGAFAEVQSNDEASVARALAELARSQSSDERAVSISQYAAGGKCSGSGGCKNSWGHSYCQCTCPGCNDIVTGCSDGDDCGTNCGQYSCNRNTLSTDFGDLTAP